MKRKKLPKKKHKGMMIYCNQCDRNFSWTSKEVDGKKTQPICKKSEKPFSSCNYPEKHVFKISVHIPNTKKGTKTKLLSANSYDEAVLEGIEFRNDFLNEITQVHQFDSRNQNRLVYLFDAQIAYADFYQDIGVPKHLKKNKKDTTSMLRALTLFNEAMEKNGVNKRIMRCDKIADVHVGHFHDYIEHYAPDTYNRLMNACKSFFKWAVSYYKLKVENPFDKVTRKTTVYNKETINKEEFEALLATLNRENGKIKELSKTGKRIRKNMYRPYLRSAFLLALHTGGRREEVVNLRWNMIKTDVKQNPYYIEVSNLKVERSKKTKGTGAEKNVAPKIIPITKSLLQILNELGYEEKKNSNDFIINPERDEKSTDWMMSILSRSFTHFFKLLDSDRVLNFKCLRKTYLTYLDQAVKEDTKSLSSHADQEVLKKHYIDEKVISTAVTSLEIFG